MAHSRAAHADEIRLQGFDRFGRAFNPLQPNRTFPYIVSRGQLRGYVNLARVGYIDSIAPYDYENSKPVTRPAEVDVLFYETLMIEDPLKRSDRMYPLIAEAVRVPEDFSYAIFEINRGARFNDGPAVTGADLYMSYIAFKSSTSEMNNYLSAVVKEALASPTELRFNFNVTGQAARDAIMLLGSGIKVLRSNTTGNPFMGGIPVRYTGTGPYTITQLSPGKISFLRNQFYWGGPLPLRRGFYNFRQIDVTAYSNQESIAAALGGSPLNYYVEDRQPAIPSLNDRLMKTTSAISLRTEPRFLMKEAKHSFAFNVARPALQDVRVRKALVLAYDYDLINQVYHSNQLVRPASLLEGTAFAPKGPPSELVQNLFSKCELPEWKNDVFERYGNNLYRQVPDKRTRLLAVMSLLREAGYTLVDEKLVIAGGDGALTPLKLKFVAFTTNEINQLIFYRNELSKLGIDAEVITPASRQDFEAILATGDYDLAATEDRVLSHDLIPRLDLAERIFKSIPSGPGRLGTVALNRLNSPCADLILQSMAAVTSASPSYYAAAEALARLQQILYLNIFAGDAKNTNYFLDRRLDVPGPLRLDGILTYGFWDAQDKE